MFLAFIAFAVAFFAVLRNSDLTDRVKKLETDRDELRTRLMGLERLLDRLKGRPAAEAPPYSPGATDPGSAPVSRENADVSALQPRIPSPQASVAATPAAPAAPLAASDPRVTSSSADTAKPVAAAAVMPVSAPSRVPSPPSPPPTLNLPASPPIDWESLLGVKGAAWVGGIALIASAIFFARWTIEQGYITPELRFAFMLFAGIGALTAAEIGLRKGYERTANPLSGAGIAILYIAFFAGHTRYELISMPTAFVGMVFVTIAACALAVRYDAFSTAVLGLLGGFATPVALSTGEDRPVGLFSYILLLNIGLIAVGARKRWPGLFDLGLIGTLFIQAGWFFKFMSPANMVVGVVSFAVLGILYLVLPLWSGDQTSGRVTRTAALGGLVPFFFALVLSGSPQYIEQWPLLFGMIGLLDLALLAFAIKRERSGLFMCGAVATALTLTVWAGQGLEPGSSVSLFGVTVSAIAITAIFGFGRRLAERIGDVSDGALRSMESAAVVAIAGLGVFGLIMIGHQRGSPAGSFLALAAALSIFLMERAGHARRIRGVLSVGALSIAILIQVWFFASVEAATLNAYIAIPVFFTLFLSLFAARDTGSAPDAEAELAVRFGAWIATFGLLLAIATKETSATGWPLFIPLVAQCLIVVLSVLRSDWTVGLPALLGATAFHSLVWQLARMKTDQHDFAMGVSVFFYLAFLTLPMAVRFAKWREAVLPWLTSALSGPVFFFPLYYVYKEKFGDTAIGLLPLSMAAVSLLALRVVAAKFVESPSDAVGARLRLRYLALFTAVTFWFISLAVPLQLSRQWITLGWALEAMALCWLFGRLPHRGLPLFAAVLYAGAGVRLLFNPAVLEYEMRGAPVFNWLLYTYGTATACCLIGQSLLRREAKDELMKRLADAIALLGLVLGFWLVNLEIFDYFSPEAYIRISDQGGYSAKLALSAGWGLYAILLLVVGVVKELKPLRYLSLAFLLLTVLKVFLYDLSELGGIFRVLSFLGLAVALILVSLFYQRFVFRKPR